MRSPRQARQGDMWPEQAGSHGHLTPPQLHALQTKSTDAANQKSFIKQHMYEILQLLSCSKDSGASTQQPARLSRAQFDRLGFILRGGPSLMREARRLSDVTPFWQDSPDSAVISQAVIEEWLGSRLRLNAQLYPPVPSMGSGQLSAAQQNSSSPSSAARSGLSSQGSNPDLSGSFDGDDLESTAMDTGNYESFLAVKPVVISGATKRTMVLTEDQVNGRNVRVMCCANATIYLLGHVKHVSLFGNNHCTIVVGAAENVVHIEHCEKTTVILASRYIRVTNSSECTVYACTNQSPHLVGENHGVVFGPYNTYYPTLESHLLAAGVNPLAEVNRWKTPELITTASAAANKNPSVLPATVGRLLPPDQLLPATIPFIIQGKTTGNPCTLPHEYAAAFEEKQKKIAALREGLKNSGLEPSAATEFEAFVQMRFKEWLVSSGNMRQVQDLMLLEQQQQQQQQQQLLTAQQNPNGDDGGNN